MKKELPIVEWLRGLAALSVCLFHWTGGNLEFHGSSALFESVAKYGWLGVEVFFVISGFIIPYALHRNDYSLSLFPKFLLKRCIRIEPAYLVTILLVIALGYLSMLFPGYLGEDYSPSIAGALLHVIYAPAYFGYEWMLPIFWTLEVELHFYILVGLIFPFLNRGRLQLFTGSAVLLALSFIVPLYLFYYISLFVMGIGSFYFLRGVLNSFQYGIMLIASSVCCYFVSESLLIPFTALATSIVLAFADRINVKGSFLGRISFSLYLVHIPIGGRLINLLGRYDDSPLVVWAGLIGITVFTIFSAWVFYKVIEKPSQLLSKRIRYSRVEKSTDNIPAFSAS